MADEERYIAVFRNTKDGLEIGGPALFPDRPNVNGILYPRKVIEAALAAVEDPTEILVVRPGNETNTLMGAVQGEVTDLRMDADGALFVRARIHPNQKDLIQLLLASLPDSNDGVTKDFGFGMTTESVTDQLTDNPRRVTESKFRSVTIYRSTEFAPYER